MKIRWFPSPLIFVSATLVVFITGFNSVEVDKNVVANIRSEYVGVWFNYTMCESHDSGSADHTCNNETLSEMLTLVASRFSKLIVVPQSIQDVQLYSSRVVEVAAEMNREANSSLLKLTVGFGMSGLRDFTKPLPFVMALHAANAANLQAPGTVTDILLLSSPQSADDEMKVFETLALTKSSENYRLGAVLAQKACGPFGSQKLPEYAFRITRRVESVVVTVRLQKDSRYKLDVATEHNFLIGLFEDCERKLKRAKEKLKVTPLVLCTAKTSSFSLECWQRMRKWAEENKRDVFLYEAFDGDEVPEIFRMEPGPTLKNMGWWKYVRNLDKNGKSSGKDFVFVEKATDLNKDNIKQDMICRSKLTIPDSSTVKHFLAIVLTPNVRLMDNEARDCHAYSNDTLETLVEMVSERFETLVVNLEDQDFNNLTFPETRNDDIGIQLQDERTSASLRLPFIIAEHNQRAAGGRSKMAVLMQLPLPNSPSNFEKLISTALATNRMSRGTVKGVLYQLEDPPNQFDLKVVRDARTRLNEKKKLHLGVSLGLEQCGGFREPLQKDNDLVLVLKEVDFVVIQLPIDYAHYDIERLLTLFHDCELKIRRALNEENKMPEVVPHVVFRMMNDVGLMEFWSKASLWAEEQSRSLIFGSAFDSQKTISGWWMSTKVWSGRITKASFVERVEHLKERHRNCYESVESKKFSGTEIVLSIICVLLVCLVSGLSYALLRSKNSERAKASEKDQNGLVCTFRNSLNGEGYKDLTSA